MKKTSIHNALPCLTSLKRSGSSIFSSSKLSFSIQGHSCLLFATMRRWFTGRGGALNASSSASTKHLGRQLSARLVENPLFFRIHGISRMGSISNFSKESIQY